MKRFRLLLLIVTVFFSSTLFPQLTNAQEEKDEFRELTESERKIFNEYKELSGDIENQNPPPEDINATIKQMKADLARKYNMSINELDKIVTNGYLEELYKIYQNW